MTYKEALEYMKGLSKRGIHPGLEGIKGLCDALGNPEKNLKIIQVAGTNGKGSTSLFLSEILKAAGYKTGLFTSPAVFDKRETIRVNGKNISEADFAGAATAVAEANTMFATAFEVETAMALLYFSKKKCDFAILEAGLGGRFDATNVSESNVLSLITPVGFDHMGFLGDTLTLIAENKAGVIKSNSLCVSAPQKPEVIEVLEAESKNGKTRLSVLDTNLLKNVKRSFSGTTFSFGSLKNLKILMAGTRQPENAALAIMGAKALSEAGYKIPEKAIYKGLEAAILPGRFEKIGERPLFFIDGAHNEPAALYLKECIETYFPKKEIVYIMGMFNDKDCDTVASITAPLAKSVITVSLPNKERTLSAIELAETVKKYNPMVSAADSIEEAVELARLMAGTDSVIVAFGSLSFLSEVKKAAGLNTKTKDSHGVKVRKA